MRRRTTKNKKTEEAATKTAATRVMAVFAIALCAAAMGASAQTWRCGNSYSDQPCEGGRTVKVDDRRSDADLKASEDAARRNERSAGRLARSRQSLEREAVGQRGPTTFDAGRFTTNAQPLTRAEQATQARQRKHTAEPRPTSARFNSPSIGDEAPKEAGKKKKKKRPTGSDD